MCCDCTRLTQGSLYQRPLVCAYVQARPSLTAFYFGLFVALVFIVCLNMFIGIISRAFLEVQCAARARVVVWARVLSVVLFVCFAVRCMKTPKWRTAGKSPPSTGKQTCFY